MKLDKLPHYAVIIRCIHERGESQRMALAELNRRGLWLSAEQKIQAGYHDGTAARKMPMEGDA